MTHDEITPTSRRNLLIATGLAAALCVSLGVNHFHGKAVERRSLELRAARAEAESAQKDAAAAKLAAHAATLAAEAERLKVEELELRRIAVEALLDSPYYAWSILGSDGKVEEWSPSLAKWSGYSAEEMKGGDITRVMPEEKREAHVSGYAELLADDKAVGKTFIIDCEIVPRDPEKKPIPVRVNARIVQLPGGKRYAIAFVDRQSRLREIEGGETK